MEADPSCEKNEFMVFCTGSHAPHLLVVRGAVLAQSHQILERDLGQRGLDFFPLSLHDRAVKEEGERERKSLVS